ncbi:hypothetical protein [Pseudarthrobacter sp. N5]|uniref:Orn/Lys/Arg family decarboxylase n=1 Tax=Pseudarthrobacter sp. N5 TaxID=3418416 RepID=UPI003CF785EB
MGARPPTTGHAAVQTDWAGRTPPRPDFSMFAARFRRHPLNPDGDIRAACFETYKTGSTTYVSAHELAERIQSGTEVISAGFVTPYPPGFPILVPGQVITNHTLEFMAALDRDAAHQRGRAHAAVDNCYSEWRSSPAQCSTRSVRIIWARQLRRQANRAATKADAGE